MLHVTWVAHPLHTHPRFGLLGIKCLEVTGDHEHEAKELDSADIVCTTPEKFGQWRLSL